MDTCPTHCGFNRRPPELHSIRMKFLRRARRRLAFAYHLHCAREDAQARNIVVPIGVWVCQFCARVSLSQRSFHDHLAAVHP